MVTEPREVVPCPFPPCHGMTVTMFQGRPGGPRDYPIIDVHGVRRGDGTAWNFECPASAKKLPMGQRAIDMLGGEVRNFARWRERETGGRSAPSTEGIPEHSLTPHPTQDRQWFLTGPERKARGMASIAEVKAAIGMANLKLAEGQEAARAAAQRFAEAKAILGGVRQETMQELGIMAAGEALKSCEDASVYANASIELNSQYGAGL